MPAPMVWPGREPIPGTLRQHDNGPVAEPLSRWRLTRVAIGCVAYLAAIDHLRHCSTFVPTRDSL